MCLFGAPGSNSTSEWISRQVASFSRYPHKRPAGLAIDGSGGMRLNQLMRLWGEKNAVTKQQVHAALQRHMHHDNSKCLRFALSDAPGGDLTIHVYKRKDAVTSTDPWPAPSAASQTAPARPARRGTKASRKVDGDDGATELMRPKAKAAPTSTAPASAAPADDTAWDEGSDKDGGGRLANAAEDAAAGEVRDEPFWEEDPPLPPADARSAPGGLDDTPRPPTRKRPPLDEERRERSARSRASSWEDDSRWRDANDEDSESSRWKASSSWMSSRPQDDWPGGSRGDSRDGIELKIMKWLNYVLKTGHRQLKVDLDDGWASIDDLADVCSQHREDFGISDGQQIRELLEQSDIEGRFALDSRGRVRKVSRDQRRPRQELVRRMAPPWRGTVASGLSRGGRVGDGEERGGEGMPIPGPEPAAEPDSVARSTGSSGCERPAPPPGDDWQRFSDDGVLWWFYDGPKGKWWMANTETKPQPFVEDTV